MRDVGPPSAYESYAEHYRLFVRKQSFLTTLHSLKGEGWVVDNRENPAYKVGLNSTLTIYDTIEQEDAKAFKTA